jgi:hypothetical protein
MLASISMPLFREWQAFWNVAPFGDERADLRAGVVAAQVFNVHRGRSQRAARPNDYAMRFGNTIRRQTPGQIGKAFEFWRRQYEYDLSRKKKRTVTDGKH